MSSRSRKTRGTDRKKDQYVPQGFPPIQMYPIMPGYPPPHWVAPNVLPNFQNSWYQPWSNQQQFHGNNSPWIPDQATKLAPQNIPDATNNEFMVNTVRRIYNNDDGSIEIERVKVQRRSSHYDTKLCSIDYPKNLSSSHSVVSDPSFEIVERKPPPRKNRKTKEGTKSNSIQNHHGPSPQNWYPYLPYMNQMYPFPYPYSYLWPSPVSAPIDSHSHTDESDCSRHEVHPSSPESSRFKKVDPLSPRVSSADYLRATSSAATSQVTGSHVTDIGPSDSISMRGFKRKTSLENMLGNVRTSTISNQTTDSVEGEKTNEWMQEMKQIFVSSPGYQSDATGDRTSFITAASEIPTPPLRSKRQPKIIRRKKSNSEGDIGLVEKLRESKSPPILSSTRVSESDLPYAYKKLEKIEDSTESKLKSSGAAEDLDERLSRASTMSFHSTRQSSHGPVDTDSTDIALPTDTATADESTDNLESETPVPGHSEINYKWVLQESEDSPPSQREEPDEREINLRDSWKAEVSLWRALLVVSLCNGQGLDQGDWNTFQLLVQHPLSISSKLSLLNAHRICSLNSDLGVVFLRNALLHLTTYGEMLLKKEKERPPGWNVIAMDGSQIWSPVKGSLEILYVFGYRLREGGILRYRPKCAPETSVISRMTLDILVLAEEFRLYLNGVNQNTMEITQLFAPLCTSPVTVQSLASNNGLQNINSEQDQVIKVKQLENQIHSSENTQLVANIPSAKEDTDAPSEKVSISSESLTPVGSTTTSKEDLDINGSPKKQIRDNPEDHIYEEITEVKAKVESLKETDKISLEPPPLPPKSRIKPDNLYPSVDLSIGSQCNSVCGSTSSRTKKRRAPMPPSFMSSKDCLEDNSVSMDEINYSYEFQKELNPFYEKHEKASGYVGKNPFYEDVKLKALTNTKDSKDDSQKADSMGSLQESTQPTSTDEESRLHESNHGQIVPIQDTIALKDDEKVQNEPGVRPQRKKLQSRSNSHDNELLTTNQGKDALANGSLVGQQEESSDSQESSVITVKNSDIVNIQYEDKSGLSMPNHKIVPSKNGEWEQQCNSLVVVPNSNLEMERNNEIANDMKEKNESKQEMEKKNESQENLAEINITPSKLEKDKEMELQSVSLNVIVANNRPEDEKDVDSKNGSQGSVEAINKLETEKEGGPQSAVQEITHSNSKPEIENDNETVVFNPCSESEKDKEICVRSAEAILPSSKPANEKSDTLQIEAIAISIKPENKRNNKLPSGDVQNTIIQSCKSDFEKEMAQQPIAPTNASTKLNKTSKLKAPYSKHPDVIIREIIISYDISLNGSEKHHTRDEKEKIKTSLKLDVGEEITPVSSLHKKSILDTIEFIDAEEDSTSDQSTKAIDNEKIAACDLNIHQHNIINELADMSGHALQTSLPKTAQAGKLQTNAVNKIVPNPPDISPPPTPPLCSPPKSLLSSPSFASQASISLRIENEQTSIKSGNLLLAPENSLSPFPILKNSDSEELPLTSVLPETPHTSLPSSPVVFLHHTKDSATLDHTEDANPCTETEANKVNEISKVTIDSVENTVKQNNNSMLADKSESITSNNHSKENIVFKHADLGASSSDAKSNKRKDKVEKDTFEERYEIPDVLRAEENMRRMQENLKKDIDSPIFTKEALDKIPERPPRHRHLHKVPPLPPKPHKQNFPPALPPKGISSSVVPTKPTPTDSKPKISPTDRHTELESHGTHSMSPSPLAIPSVSPQLYTAPAINELRQMNSKGITQGDTKTNSGSQSLSFRGKSHKNGESKPTQKYYVPTKSVSMPSSPKASLSRLKPDTKSEKDRKSWPFQLCNCLYSKDYKKEDQIKIKYVRD